MMRWLSFPAVQIALCLAVFALAGWRWGPLGMVWTSPLLGAAICRPVMHLVAGMVHRIREHTWLPVHGRHYVYKGVTVNVLEDDQHRRWVRLEDARKVAGFTATERALTLAYPGRCERFGKGGAYLRDDALVEHMGKENNPAALRFRTWAERTIALPGRKVRSNLGITERDDD